MSALAESAVSSEPLPLLSLKDVRTGFGVHAVLHGVSFDAPVGRITALLGLNGAGKSVTLKTISGLIPAWSGNITFENEDITEIETEDRVRRGMAHVLQGRAVFPHLSVEENLRLGAAVIEKSKVPAAMESVFSTFPRLAERKTQRAGTLSGGEQEMLAVGRALMSSPKLILVDEASQGLAPKAVEQLFETLKNVNATGVTILMVEQNVTFTLAIADKVEVMQKGQIVYSGTANDLDRPRLASLLGIGALLSKVIEQPEPADEPPTSEAKATKPKAKPRTSPKPKPKPKTKTAISKSKAQPKPKAKAKPKVKPKPKPKAKPR